jgi:hypothetical protein
LVDQDACRNILLVYVGYRSRSMVDDVHLCVDLDRLSFRQIVEIGCSVFLRWILNSGDLSWRGDILWRW